MDKRLRGEGSGSSRSGAEFHDASSSYTATTSIEEHSRSEAGSSSSSGRGLDSRRKTETGWDYLYFGEEDALETGFRTREGDAANRDNAEDNSIDEDEDEDEYEDEDDDSVAGEEYELGLSDWRAKTI
mmetsp:Transcript_6026/g.22070  ORF Transcript_6026/g.22070 Transcript_6026/m.22070 type:complete len:128 (-) Transcript_6026:298-681(-)